MKYNKKYDKEYIEKMYNTIISYLQKYGKVIYINSEKLILRYFWKKAILNDDVFF